MADYEKAVRNAIRECFHAIVVEGCMFHHPQATWRSLGNKGFWVAYKEIEGFARSFKSLNALAFIPPNEVNYVYRLLLNSEDFCPALVPFATGYFYPTWIQGTDNKYYKVEDWNAFNR